jgi:hypothetical protein
VYVIEISAGPHDFDELLIGATAFGQSRLVRRQIAGIKVENGADRAKIAPSAQIRTCVDLFGPGKWRNVKIGTAPGGKFRLWTCGVAPVAITSHVHDITSQPYECPVLTYQIQLYGGDLETTLNERFLILVAVIVVGSYGFDAVHQCRYDKDGAYRQNSVGLGGPVVCHGKLPRFV